MIKTKDLILASMFAALTVAGAFIKIPIPYVPFTLQFLFCSLSGIVLGSRLGGLSQIVYVLLGLIGIPVFTEGGGIWYIFKPTFGYLIGFIVGAFVIGKIIEDIKVLTAAKSFLAILTGLFFVYLFGVIYLFLINNLYLEQHLSIFDAVFYGFIICAPGDVMISFLTALFSVKIVSAVRKTYKYSILKESR